MKRLARALGAFALVGCLAFVCPRAQGAPSETTTGHPRVTLDQLDLTQVPLAASDEQFLRDVLAREARAADWGAGRKASIEYRFRLEELAVMEEAKVVKVRCSATGMLPRGKRVRGHLSLGGAPQDRQGLVRHVLSVVARSVVTRLADMERHRRAQ